MVPMLIAIALLIASVFLCFEPWLLKAGVTHLRHLAFHQGGFLFQRVNRTDPEKVFIAVYNSYSTAAMTNGQGVIWDFATDADGVGVTRPTARATNAGFAAAGIIAETIAAGAYGLCQVYGYHAATRVRSHTGGAVAIVPGRPLVINAAGSLFCLESISTASIVALVYPMAFSLGSTSGWTTIAKPVFVKSL